MMAGTKAGNFLLQPRDHRFTDEAAKLIVAGVVLLAGFHIKVIDESERDGRQRATVEQSIENRDDLHFLQIKFAVEKEAEPLGLVRWAA